MKIHKQLLYLSYKQTDKQMAVETVPLPKLAKVQNEDSRVQPNIKTKRNSYI